MIVILCIDDRGGMLFNKRRLSSDEKVIERILEISAPGILRMDPYSAPLFQDSSFFAEEDFLEKAEEGDFCFVENQNLSAYTEKIEEWIIFRWNRHYPSDLKFDLSLLSGKTLVQATDFEGNSHPRITEEVYR